MYVACGTSGARGEGGGWGEGGRETRLEKGCQLQKNKKEEEEKKMKKQEAERLDHEKLLYFSKDFVAQMLMSVINKI